MIPWNRFGSVSLKTANPWLVLVTENAYVYKNEIMIIRHLTTLAHYFTIWKEKILIYVIRELSKIINKHVEFLCRFQIVDLLICIDKI